MRQSKFERAIVWFRRDLRIEDNASLAEACVAAKEIIPLFIVDEDIFKRPDTGTSRVIFLLDALSVLDKNLQRLGGRLVLRKGKVPDELVRLAREVHADALFYQREYEPYGIARDRRVTELLQSDDFEVLTFPGLCANQPGDIMNQSGKPYTVFTPYKNVWFQRPTERIYSAPAHINVPATVVGEDIPTQNSLKLSTSQKFECGGEDEAYRLLSSFSEKKVSLYREGKDVLSEHGTSKLSRHLHLGTISVNKIVQTVRDKKESDSFLTELAWRDFYFQILYHFPYVEKAAFRQTLDDIKWQDDDMLFNAWTEGKTGYPIVDAAMRQLNTEAWMHNRARMIVASFLTKDLLINWQWGEQYFMQMLVDGDLAANNGGWQWSAGTGTDAQPYFRIFNPVSQGERFDPKGLYVRQYVPELRDVPDEFIHSPWKMSDLDQLASGCTLGKDYPLPIVDHKKQRIRALEMYRKIG